MTVGPLNTEQQIIQNIKDGFVDSRTLSKQMDMSQEYIRRIVTKLSGEGMVTIIKAPRGYTYEAIK